MTKQTLYTYSILVDEGMYAFNSPWCTSPIVPISAMHLSHTHTSHSGSPANFLFSGAAPSDTPMRTSVSNPFFEF